MDRNFIPTALAMAGGIALWLAIFPTLFGRKGSGDSEILNHFWPGFSSCVRASSPRATETLAQSKFGRNCWLKRVKGSGMRRNSFDNDGE